MHLHRAAVAIVPAAEAKPTRTGSLRALSYNVAGLPEPLSGSDPAINSPLISPLLNDYDLVLLQESWQDVLHDQRQAGLLGEEIPPIMYHHLVVGDVTHPYRSEPKPHPLGLDLARLPTGPPLLSERLYGGGVTDGVVTALAPVPKPLQQPHPPVFQPFASSERSIRWCAAEGITAILPPLHPVLEQRLVDTYAGVSGRPPGDGIALLRDVVVAPTDEEAMALWANGALFGFQSWFSPFGFDRGIPHPDTGEMPDMMNDGVALVGSVDTVARQLEGLLARLPCRWVFCWEWNSLIPDDALRRSIELFATEVVPKVGERLDAPG